VIYCVISARIPSFGEINGMAVYAFPLLPSKKRHWLAGILVFLPFLPKAQTPRLQVSVLVYFTKDTIPPPGIRPPVNRNPANPVTPLQRTAQVAEGMVLDQRGEAVAFALIYIKKTKTVVRSNASGHFLLVIPQALHHKKFSLLVTATGYVSTTIKIKKTRPVPPLKVMMDISVRLE
jgi:CarboxypepD_reg-like domain